MPEISSKKLFYSGLYSDYLSIEEKDPDILYLCTDVKKVFKGDIDMTTQVEFDFYRPASPISGKVYIFSASGTAEVYDGTTWNVVAYPILGTNDVATQILSAGSTQVTFDAPDNDEVVDFYTDNGAQYTGIDTSVTDKIVVKYAAQQENDVVHMRIYENKYYNSTIISSLCLDNLQITHQPDTTLFAVGDPVDVSGIQVTGTLGSSTYDLTEYIETMPPIGSKIETEIQSLRIIFGAKEVSLPVNTIPAFDELVVTTMPTKTIYKVAEKLDLTGLVVTAYAGNRAYSKDVTSICKFRPKNGTILNRNNQTYTINVIYENMSTSFNVETRGPENLESATWAEIKAAINDGTISNFARVGDAKTFIYAGQTYHAQLAAINDGTGASGAYYPARTADFISVELMSTNVRCYDASWEISSLRNNLNNSVYKRLPSDLKNVIVEKTRYYNYWGGDYNWNASKLISDYLWLPSIYELSASDSPAAFHRGWSVENSNYCKHYELFSDQPGDDPSRIKHINDSIVTVYPSLPMSKINNTSVYYSIVTETGKMAEIASSSFFMPICFRIG